MPSKSEIEFCERWLDLRGADGFDGCVVWREPLEEAGFPGSTMELMVPIMPRPPLQPWDYLFALTPRGADLVASYEAAVSMGEVKPDDAPEPAFKPCPDCEFGRVSIPGLMSIVPVDPDNEITQTMRCPTCNGAKVVETETVRDIGRPLAGLGEGIEVAKRAFASLGPVVSTRTGVHASAGESNRWSDLRQAGVIDDWRQLTRAEGERLAGKPFEARRNVDDPPRRHVAMAAPHLASAGILRLVGGGNMRFDGTWWVRDAVAPEADVWQPLTHELAETLTGKRIEARSSGDPHPCTVIGLSPCAKWLRVDFIDGRYERAGALGLRGGWYVRVIDEAWVTEPAAMMALLEEARLEGFEVEVKATERPGGKSSHRKLGSGGPVSLVHAFSAVQAYVNFTWCAVAGYRGEYVGASPILTAVRRANGGRHGDA